MRRQECPLIFFLICLFQVNPNIVGRGKWADIKNIRATFDFGSKDIVADIVKAEEENMTENQQRLEDEYQQMS